jgi:hypothetical protein
MVGVLGLSAIAGLVRRHRRVTALVGVILVLGVVALNAHAALPEHHHGHGERTLCLAAMSIAVLAAFGLCARDRRTRLGRRLSNSPVARSWPAWTVSSPLAAARAGPPGPLVLRI